jgi:transcriptional regulator with XRE-family HTH domain
MKLRKVAAVEERINAAPMELAHALDHSRSPLAKARLARRLPVREAARRAGLTEDEVTWLEEGRVYRFASPDDALLALVLYATALGIDHREARALVGLPVPQKGFEVNPWGRLVVLGAIAAALVALVIAVVLPGELAERARDADAARASAEARLPKPWQVRVDVLNGSGDITWTRQVASRIAAFGYQVTRVARADRFDYPHTAVYYQPGGQGLAARLARQLGVVAKPLPGGDNARRLVVVVGTRRGPG